MTTECRFAQQITSGEPYFFIQSLAMMTVFIVPRGK